MSEEKLILRSNVKTILASRGITMEQMKADLKLTNNLGTNLLSRSDKIKGLNIDTIAEICNYLDCDIKDMFSFRGFDPLEIKPKKK
jgi:DNA-binding Xre family transcriptional regulator